MGRILDIEILKWDDFNPKRDQKSYTWLRLNNDIITDPKLFGLDAEQKLCWIEILCQASKKAVGRLKINLDQVAHVTQVKIVRVEKLIEFLVTAAIISVHDNARSHDVVDHVPSLQNTTPTNVTNERTNDTNERYETPVSPGFAPPDLFDLWNQNRGPLPKAEKFTEKRKSLAKAQIKLYPEPDHWTRAIAKFTESKFCVETWKPGFDDLLSEAKRIKALEGRYDEKTPGPSSGPKTREQQAMDHTRDQYERVLKGEL